MRNFKHSIFAMAILLCCVATSCSHFNSGESFVVTTDDGIYRCEVIVSYMNYVRIYPAQSAEEVTGTVRIPSTVSHDGNSYVVSQIGANAFQDYTNITKVVLPPTISVIEDAAFKNCSSLAQINTPQPLSTVGDYAFDGCSSLETFNLKASISKLGVGCFRNCAALTSLDFPSSFTTVPSQAFYGCTSLTSIKLPATITIIGNGAFGNCTNAASLIMGSSVKTIGESAFANCGSLQSVNISTAMPPTCDATTFENVPAEIPVTVPMSHVADYQNAAGWNHFSNFVGTY